MADPLALLKDASGAEATVRNQPKTLARLNADETELLVMITLVHAVALAAFGTQPE